jgi:aryl-alcohol dehydrogenase-like predicted oxidoreductase
MEYRNLGRTGLKVSRLFFGGSHIGEIVESEKARTLIEDALDAGINTFYTADKYNNGAGQDIIGPALKARRDDVILLIKTGYRVGTPAFPVSDAERLATHGEAGAIDHDAMWQRGVPPTSRGLTRKHIMLAVEESLRRLQTDYIDVYVAHFWDAETPIEETLSAMTTLVRQGKVRYIGCSQTSAWQLQRALWVSELNGFERYQSQQIRFNMLERKERKEQLAGAASAGVSILAFSSLAGGVLSGEYEMRTGIPDGLGFRQMYTRMYWNEKNFELVDALREVAREGGRTVGELAQAWTLAQVPVTALQIGPSEPEEFESQVRAATHPLTLDESTLVTDILARFQ